MMRRLLSCLVCILLLLSFVACKPKDSSGDETVTAGEYGTINDGKPIELKVDLQSIMPSVITEPTADNPIVIQVSQKLADQFTKMYPNVTITWERGKGAFGDWAQWMITEISAGTPADITFMQGATYADRNWFIPLDSYLEQPNIYIEGNEKWKDTFPSYLWNSYMTSDANGNIVAIPVTLYPGVATAYFYNKDIFKKVGVSVPKNWEEFITICEKLNDAGYIAVGPWSLNKTPIINCWDIQFSLGPTFSLKMKDKWDYDGNGIMSQNELLRAEYEGQFYSKNNPAVLEIYKQVKRKYKDVLQEGAANTDYETLWKEGKVAMMEDGVSRLALENADMTRPFEYGMFAAPIADSSTSEYAADVEYETGPYQPPVANSFNIVRPAVEGNKGREEAAVRFLQWITKPENTSQIVIEMQGQALGAVKGSAIPPALEEWFKQVFPRIPQTQWVLGPTIDSTDMLSRYLEMWVSDYIDDKTFLEQYDKILKEGVEAQIEGLGVDTNGWEESK